MNEEEKIALEVFKDFAYDISCIGASHCKIDKEDMSCDRCIKAAYEMTINLINRLQKENAELKEKIKEYEIGKEQE